MTQAPAALASFLNPAAIAVIGASPDEGKLRGRITHFLANKGFRGALYPINPSHAEIHGRRCYPAIGAVPGPVDLAIIVVPAGNVLEAVQQCADKGARHALIMSSGFAEEGGAQADVQDRIAAIARASGMRLCGPNAEGFHNEIERISATFSPAVDLRPETLFSAGGRRVGIIAQSGGVGYALYHRGRALGLDFSHVITVGNEADLTVADFFAHLADDDETGAILLFIETVRDAAGFTAAALRAAGKDKPVVAVKVGRSAAAAHATASHTGSMAGWDAAYDAVFRAHGIIVADDLDRALAIIGALTTCPLPRGRRAAVITVSGGGGALAADALAAAGLDLPPLSAETQAAIRRMIPSYGAPRNPVDITGQATRTGALLKVIDLLSAGDEVDMIVAVTTMASETRTPVDVEAWKALRAAGRKPVLFYAYTLASEFGRRGMAAAGSVTYLDLTDLAAAAAALAGHAAFTPPAAPPRQAVAAPELEGLSGIVAEHRAKQILESCGIAVPARRLVRTPGELAPSAEALGYPLALKVQSAQLPHKTEAGGVRLGIGDAASLRAGYYEVLADVRRHAPTASIDGVLLERMAPKGVEVIIGLVRDATFGPILTLGMGGVTTELYRDVARRPAPIGIDAALAMLRELRGFPLLDGFRGAPRADLEALARLAAQIAALGLAAPRLREIELNPVLVHPRGEGCTVVDAMLVVDPP